MLLERLGLHQCQGSCVQPVRSKSRVHLEGASVIVQQVAKHPNICKSKGTDQCAGMVESRRNASDASGTAGSQQGYPDERTPGEDIWVRSTTEGNILHSRSAGKPVHFPIPSHRIVWAVKCRVPPV